MKACAILLAGGRGSRMGNATTPKQFMQVRGKLVAQYSLDVFDKVDSVSEIIVVADESYRHLFSSVKPIKFASPGDRRQDSVYNGLNMAGADIDLVCVHDCARPFLTEKMVVDVLAEAQKSHAATVAMPIKFTVKEAGADRKVRRTIDRNTLWEIQTPQAVAKKLLHDGFKQAKAHNLTVTDDVSLAELVGHPVQLVFGSYANIKITTPDDLQLAELLARGMQ